MVPVTLATIEGSNETERLVLQLVPCEQEGQCLELARQTWCEALGWFTQSRVRVSRDEVYGLRSALGCASISPRTRVKVEGPDPAILRFPQSHSA